MDLEYTDQIDEQREFLRVDHEERLIFRELKANKLSQRSDMVTRNISACGLLFRTTDIPPALSSMLWLQLDPRMMNICAEIEEDLIMRDEGVLGRVVRIAEGEPGISYDVGVCFLRKKDMSDDEIADLLPDK